MTREARSSLVSLVAGPLIWAAHFLLSYITAAIWCAKAAGTGRSLGSAQLAIVLFTAAALAALGALGWRAWRQHRVHAAEPEDRDTPEARHQFVTFATLLLLGLGAIAIVYESLAIMLVGSCR